MKLKYEFSINEVAGEIFAMPLGISTLDFTGLIKLNDTGALILKILEKEIKLEELISRVRAEFPNIDEKTIETDVLEFVENVRNAGFLE